MKETLTVAKVASKEIEHFLRNKKETIEVINVEDDDIYRKKDIDLIWKYKIDNKIYERTIEIKGDRYSHTGNFFIETKSNIEKGTPGCFLYTEADMIFYYFIDTKELNIIPMKSAKKWFVKNMHRFKEKFLSTKVYGDIYYTSSGRLVPKKIMHNEVLGMKKKILTESCYFPN